MLKAFSASSEDVVASEIGVPDLCTAVNDSPSLLRSLVAASSSAFSMRSLPSAVACSCAR